MISVLNTVLELEDKVLRKRTPSIIKMHYLFYIKLIKELEETKFMNKLHGLPIQLIVEKTIIVE